MKTVTPAIYAEIREHAKEAMPNEACGFIVNAKRKRFIVRAANVAAKPTENWRINPAEQVAAEAQGTIVGIYHTHPYGRAVATDADKYSCEAVGVPYLIAAYPVDEYTIIQPKAYIPPLEGREFVHGILDCYSLCRDYYKITHKIELPNFHREDDWWAKGQDLYIENFQSAGFVEIGNDWRRAQIGDAFIMRLFSDTRNHAAIYVDHNTILHHVMRGLSRKEFLSQFWQDCISIVLRHKSLIK